MLPAQSAADTSRTDNLPTDKGQLSLSNVTVNLTNTNLEVVFVPLDERVLRLLTRDSYLSLERLIAAAPDAASTRRHPWRA